MCPFELKYSRKLLRISRESIAAILKHGAHGTRIYTDNTAPTRRGACRPPAFLAGGRPDENWCPRTAIDRTGCSWSPVLARQSARRAAAGPTWRMRN